MSVTGSVSAVSGVLNLNQAQGQGFNFPWKALAKVKTAKYVFPAVGFGV